MLFEVAILNLVCGCILDNRLSCTCFGVTVTLTSFLEYSYCAERHTIFGSLLP